MQIQYERGKYVEGQDTENKSIMNKCKNWKSEWNEHIFLKNHMLI